MTIKNIVKFAEAKGMKFEITFPQSFVMAYTPKGDTINDYNSKTQNGLIVGVEFKPGVWYWFKNWDGIMDSDNTFFEQRYNQANGAIQKSFKQGQRFMCAVEQFLTDQIN
jgi:hypothetical protein